MVIKMRRCLTKTLYRWRDEFLAGGEAALAGKTNKQAGAQLRELEELKKQVAKRDQVIGELTIANRILKKAEDRLL